MVRRGALLAGVAAAAGAAVAVLAYDPFAEHALGCPVYEATGLLCPGCGSTRAAWLLLHGDLAGVVRHNLLFLPALAFLVARWAHLVAPAATGWLPGAVRSPTEVRARALWAFAGVVVAFTVARNLPVTDFLGPPT